MLRPAFITAFALAVSTALTLLAVVSTAQAQSTTPAQTEAVQTDEFLEGRIFVDRRVRLPQGGAAARIPVNMELSNTGTEDIVITAPSICQVHNYNIVYPNNDLIAAKGDGNCTGEAVTLTIKAGETMYASNSLMLNRGLLETGRRYYVIYEFWGVRMRAPFVILEHE
ncbi:MAG: hypothetical protein P1U65_14185 [Minwuia sp.]|nr:hypothetical protein [Minwuia sp.]